MKDQFSQSYQSPAVHAADGEAGVSAAHTPGPWKVQHDLVISRATYDTICAVKRPTNRAWTVENPATEDANARLIAASPTMFDELAYLASANDWFGQQRFAEDSDADFLLRVLGAVRARARAALAKALTPSTLDSEGLGSSVAGSGRSPPAAVKSDSEGGY